MIVTYHQYEKNYQRQYVQKGGLVQEEFEDT